MEQTVGFTREIIDALGAPFPEDEMEFVPRATSGGMALGLPYIDARSVMRRLDAAVGPGNWSFDFDMLSPEGKMVKGRLTVMGVTKCDAGEASAEDEALKSAVSDALKRCGVHFGIGRYLYYLPKVWAPYDTQKRRFTETPRLDRSAVERALAVCGLRPQSAGCKEQSAPSPERASSGTGSSRSIPATRSSSASSPRGPRRSCRRLRRPSSRAAACSPWPRR